MPQITHAVCVHVWTVVDLMWFKREREPKLASKASHWSTALLTAETFKRTDHPYAAILLLEACFLRGAVVSEIPSPSQTGSVAFALWSSGVVNLHSHSGPFPLVCLLVYMFQSSSPSVAFRVKRLGHVRAAWHTRHNSCCFGLSLFSFLPSLSHQ